jgi:hypothetical protein
MFNFSNVIPNLEKCDLASLYWWVACRRDFEGMHPSFKQVPPFIFNFNIPLYLIFLSLLCKQCAVPLEQLLWQQHILLIEQKLTKYLLDRLLQLPDHNAD